MTLSVAILLALKSKITPVQWAGIAAIVVGVRVLAAGKAREVETVTRQTAADDSSTRAAVPGPPRRQRWRRSERKW